MNVIDNINVQEQEYSLRGMVSKVPFVFITMDPDSDENYHVATPEIFKDIMTSLINEENIDAYTITFSDSLFPICIGAHILEPLTNQNVPNQMWYLNMFTILPYLLNYQESDGAIIDQYFVRFPEPFANMVEGSLTHYKATGQVTLLLSVIQEES